LIILSTIPTPLFREPENGHRWVNVFDEPAIKARLKQLTDELLYASLSQPVPGPVPEFFVRHSLFYGAGSKSISVKR